MREAWGIPAAVLVASHIGFGAAARALDFSFVLAVFSTVALWALPGQLIMVESWAAGAAVFAIVPAVMFSAARFLPMAVVLMPVLRDARRGPLQYYSAAHLISMTTWAVTMQRCPQLPVPARLPFFFGFSLVCWLASMAAVAAGFALAGSIPAWVGLGLIFLTPMYFLLILIGEAARQPSARAALICGAVAGPLLHLAVPQWGVLLAGVIGGTAAFYVNRAHRSRDE